MSRITVQAIICDGHGCHANAQSRVLNHEGLWEFECEGWTLETETQGEWATHEHFCPKCSKDLPPLKKRTSKKRELSPANAEDCAE